MKASPPRPLEGVRVLDLARLIPGALVSRWLGDLGADVLKVEEEGRGDYMRGMPPYVDGQGLMQAMADSGKSSLELDLRSEEGANQLRRLAEVADVIIEGARPGSLKRLGLDLAELRRTRPEVIVCSITGFGLHGPLAGIPSHGMSIDTLAGVADVQKTNGRWKLRGTLTSTISVEIGVLNGVIGILACVANVRRGGEGAWIDVSLWDAAVEANRINVALAYLDADQRLVIGDQGPLYSVYECADHRLVMFGAIEEKFWLRFCKAVGREDLIPRWGSVGEIGFGDDESLADDIASVFTQRTASEWADLFEKENIPINTVLDVDDVVQHPHFADRRLIAGQIGQTRIPNILNPIVWVDSGARLGTERGPAPSLGEGGADVARKWLEQGVST